jgi:cytochrome P450
MFVIIAIVIGLLSFLLFRKKKTSHPSIVCAEGHWFLGNVDDWKPEKLLTTLKEFPIKYGPIVELFLLWKRVLLITDPVLAKEILIKRPNKFGRLKALDYANHAMHTESSLFLTRGSLWSRIRRSTAPSFSHLNVVKKVIDISREIFTWVQTLKSDPDLANKTIDMQTEAFRITTRIITVVAFGLPTDHPLVAYFLGPFRQDVLKFMAFVGASAIYPFPRIFWKYSSKYALEKTGVEANNRVMEEGKKIIAYKRQLVKEGKLTTSTCMIDTMLLNEGHSERALTDEEIIINVRGIYIAGADTTAIIISWSSYYFALYPQIQERVRQEAIEILFHGQSPKRILEDFDLEIFQKMVYTNAVISEILRLGTAASNISMELEEENDEYQLANGITVRSGDMIYINIDGMQADPKIFEDPFQFNPDRWLTADSEKLAKMKESFMPFGFGPRICPGMGLAMHESLLALSMFAYYFNFKLNCPKDEIIRLSTFVNPPNKMPMTVTPRTDIID